MCVCSVCSVCVCSVCSVCSVCVYVCVRVKIYHRQPGLLRCLNVDVVLISVRHNALSSTFMSGIRILLCFFFLFSCLNKKLFETK